MVAEHAAPDGAVAAKPGVHGRQRPVWLSRLPGSRSGGISAKDDENGRHVRQLLQDTSLHALKVFDVLAEPPGALPAADGVSGDSRYAPNDSMRAGELAGVTFYL